MQGVAAAPAALPIEAVSRASKATITSSITTASSFVFFQSLTFSSSVPSYALRRLQFLQLVMQKPTRLHCIAIAPHGIIRKV
jgi:hypothetical protein